jgi:polyhydroxyalkanoate synthesis regulator phasin
MAVFDINAFEQKYGVSSQAAPLDRSNLTTVNRAKPQGFSPSNLVHSIAAIPSSVGHFVADAMPNIPRLATAISQGLPIVGSIHQNQQMHNAAMKGIDAAHASYTKQFQQGKISKDRYRKLVTDLSKDRQAQTDVLTKQAKEYVKPADFAKDLVGTATLPLAAGRLTTEGGAKVASLATKAGGVATSRGTAGAAVAAPIKNALIYHPTAEAVGQVAQGKDVVKNAALTAATVAAPGIVKVAGKAAGLVKNAIFDSAGLFDHVQLSGGQTVTQALKAAEQMVAQGKMSESKYKTIVDRLKVSQDQNLANHGSPTKAARMIAQTQETAGRPTTNMTLEQFANEQGKLADAGRKTQKMFSEGRLFNSKGEPVSDTLGAKVTVGKAAASDKAQIGNRLADAAKEGGQFEEYGQLKKDFPDFFKNKNNAASVQKILSEAKSPAEIKSRINSEITGTNQLFTKNAAGELVPATHAGGYHSIVAQNRVPNFNVPSEVGNLDTGNKAPLGVVGDAIRKAGLSPEPTDHSLLSGTLKENFNKHIDQIPELAGRGDDIYKALGSQLGNGVLGTYERQLLSKRELTAALEKAGIGANHVKDVRKALDAAHADLPAELRGAGGKVTDFLTSHGERGLLRVQHVGRFSSFNPFFQAKVALKSEALGQAYSGGHIPMGPVPKEVDRYISESGLSRVFEQNFTDFVGDLPKVNRGVIGKIQQNTAGRMVNQMLKNRGVTVQQLENNPTLKHEVDHAIETVFGYPKGGFLDSNFAKSMNVVLFPFRFEAKVAGAMGHFMLKQSPIVRTALVNDIAQAHDWLKSSEGQDWVHKNSEMVSLARYFTPIDTVSHMIEALGGSKDLKLQDFGLLGGLPLGFVSTILDGQGADLGPLGSGEFRDPKTGELVPKKIPADQATRVKKGLIDLINSLYSYPGRQLGLSSKSDIVTTVAPPLKGGRYNKVGGENKPPSSVAAPKAPATAKPTNVLRGATLSDAMKAEAVAKANKPKKGPRVKHKAVRPGQPF